MLGRGLFPEFLTFGVLGSGFHFNVAGHAGLQDILEQYYVGLIESVAAGRGLVLDRVAAEVELTDLGNGHFTAEIDLVDAFVTGKELLLHMDITLEGKGQGALLSVAASPRARGEALWAELFAVREYLKSSF